MPKKKKKPTRETAILMPAVEQADIWEKPDIKYADPDDPRAKRKQRELVERGIMTEDGEIIPVEERVKLPEPQ